jgi:hypothetical protein
MMAVTETCVTPTNLAAFLEGSLTGEERDQTVRHLNHCPDCFERYIGAARLLDAIEEEEASALLAADVNVVAQNLSYDYLPPRNLQLLIEADAQYCMEPTPNTPVEVARESARRLLLEALATLSPEDRLIVRMRERFSTAEIARTLNLEHKPLYRRLERIYASLVRTLKSKGVRAGDIADILRKPEHESDESGK